MNQITVVVPLAENADCDFLDNLNLVENPVEVIVEKGKNPSENRNRGIARAKTPYIAFVNGHTILNSDWYSTVVRFFKDHPEIDVVGGPQTDYALDNYFAKVSHYAFSSRFGAGHVISRYRATKENLDADESFVTTANLICRRHVFEKVRFNEQIYPGEDPKFIEDIRNSGLKVAYSPDILVSNRRRDSLTGLFKQIYQYGVTRPIKESLRFTLKKPLFLVPSGIVLYLSVLILVSLFFKLHLLFFIPLISYLSLAVIFSLFIALRNKDFFSFFLLPIIFGAIHFSYGLGFLLSSLKRYLRL